MGFSSARFRLDDPVSNQFDASGCLAEIQTHACLKVVLKIFNLRRSIKKPDWLLVDTLIVLAYGLQHSLLTTKTAVTWFEKVLPIYLWNILYSAVSVVTLVVGFKFWESSGVYLFHFVPGSIAYHLSTAGLALSLFLFFYCFKFTTSFLPWFFFKI